MENSILFEKQLTPQQRQKLIDYTENQLKSDVAAFETAFGYKGNAALIKWLLVYCLFEPQKITFQPKAHFGQSKIGHFELNKHFYHLLTKKGIVDPATISQFTFEGYIPVFTSFFNIGGDGMGNFFFTNFIEKDSDIVFYDHENALDSYKILTLEELMQSMSIKSIAELTAEIIAQKGSDLGLHELRYKHNFSTHNPLVMRDQVFDFMLCLQKNQPLKEMSAHLKAPLVEEGVLSELLTNPQSDYYQYDNVRAAYNPLIIAHLYWHFLTGNDVALGQLLEESTAITGRYYQAIRRIFIAFGQGDLSQLPFSYPELNRLRKGIDMPDSLMRGYERTYFKEAIRETEQKIEEALRVTKAHESDPYFTLDYGSGITDWALFPVETRYIQERPLNAFKIWENPVPIVCTLKHNRQTHGEPNILADVLPWQTAMGSVSFAVSEHLKNILLEYDLPPHSFYDVVVQSQGKTIPYYAFVLFQSPEMIHYIDFEKTVFYLESSNKPKHSIIGDLQFRDYPQFVEERRAYSLNNFELKVKNKTLYLNRDLDLFLFTTSFFISNRLKRALENKVTGAHFNDLNQFERILPVTKIIGPSGDNAI